MRRQILFAAAALLIALFAGASYVLHAQAPTVAELRGELVNRYEIVALQQGIALVPKQPTARVRMIQVVDGAVTVDGETLTAAQLRDRLGADATAVIQLTYLDREPLRQLAGEATSPLTPPPAAVAPPPAISRSVGRQGDIVRIGGGSINVGSNERVQGDVVAIFGPVNVDGEVTGDVVSVMGPLTVGPHAIVRGDVTAVGGTFNRAPESQVFGDVNEVSLGSGIPRRPGVRDLVGSLGSGIGGFASTIARLLLMILLALLAVAVLRRPVEQIAARAATDPIRSTLVGLLAEILFVPVLLVTCFALVVSIIGIPLLVLVPFAIVLIGLVMLVGFTGAAYQVGGIVLHRFGRNDHNPYLSVAAGAVVIAAVTLVAKLVSIPAGFIVGMPFTFVGYVIEYLAWTMGFGAAILAWFNLRKRPASPPIAPPIPGEA
jgi:hypothetical protein